MSIKVNKDNIDLMTWVRDLVYTMNSPGAFILKSETINSFSGSSYSDTRHTIEMSIFLKNKLYEFDTKFGYDINHYINNKGIIDRDDNFGKLIGTDDK